MWSGVAGTGTRRGGDTSYINEAWLQPTKGRDVGETVIRRLLHAHNPAVINVLKRADAQG